MIKSSKGITRIVGRKEEVATDLAVIFGELIKIIGEDETKKMIRIAYEDSESKIKKVSNKELKEILKRDLPEELAKILCELL